MADVTLGKRGGEAAGGGDAVIGGGAIERNGGGEVVLVYDPQSGWIGPLGHHVREKGTWGPALGAEVVE